MKVSTMRIRIRSTKDHIPGVGVYATKKTDYRLFCHMVDGSHYGVQQTYNLNEAVTYKTVNTAMNYLFGMRAFDTKRRMAGKPYGVYLEVEKDGQIHSVTIDEDCNSTRRQLTIVSVASDPNSKQVTAGSLAAFLQTLPADEPIHINGCYLQVGETAYSISDLLTK